MKQEVIFEGLDSAVVCWRVLVGQESQRDTNPKVLSCSTLNQLSRELSYGWIRVVLAEISSGRS